MDLRIIIYRSKLIQHFMIGNQYIVSNGRFFFRLFVKKEMLGFKFGEFIFTRKIGRKLIQKKLRKKQSGNKKSI